MQIIIPGALITLNSTGDGHLFFDFISKFLRLTPLLVGSEASENYLTN